MSRRRPTAVLRAIKEYGYSPAECWEAAIIEGEGSYSCGELKVDSTDRDVIATLAFLWKATVRGPFQYRPDSKVYYRVAISGDRAKRRIERLWFLLHDRRRWDWLGERLES